MLIRELPAHKASQHPLNPRNTESRHTVLLQPDKRESQRLQRMCTKEKIKQALLDIRRPGDGPRFAGEEVIVERGAGGDDFAAGGEGHYDACDDYRAA